MKGLPVGQMTVFPSSRDTHAEVPTYSVTLHGFGIFLDAFPQCNTLSKREAYSNCGGLRSYALSMLVRFWVSQKSISAATTAVPLGIAALLSALPAGYAIFPQDAPLSIDAKKSL